MAHYDEQREQEYTKTNPSKGKTMTKAYMILDLQFGSTGKGLLAGYLAKTKQPDVLVTAWGPNAGHTYIDEDGREFIHRMLANGIVSPKLKSVLIGPGSVIDLDVLKQEIESCKDLLIGKEIIIHPTAVVVTQHHRDIEARNVKIGSTMKGTGAAVISRIERDPDNSPVAMDAIPYGWLDDIAHMGVNIAVNDEFYDEAIRQAELIQIEGAQGYSLSIYHGFYPYCTSRDVTPAQVMADTAMPFSIIPEVYGTLRTLPIRVANRYNEAGEQIGTSGPGYWDQKELDWEKIGIEPELTTVTKLPRRIFSFSMAQTKEACYRCGPTKLFLNFANYLTKDDAKGLIKQIHMALAADGNEAEVTWVGIGPNHEHVLTNREFTGE
jgi:adenylosuccinate synthase